ncbi:hypothetical protein [Bradyrhizobium sp. RDM4]
MVLEYPDELEITPEIGEVVAVWLLYAHRPRYSCTILASHHPELQDRLL